LFVNIAASWSSVNWDGDDWSTIPVQTLTSLAHRVGTKGDDRIRLAFGYAALLFVDRPISWTVNVINKLFQLAQITDTPVYLRLSDFNWWENRPELWNWFDSARPGFDRANIDNVEWSCFDPGCAYRDSFRDWGTPVWLGFPPPNLNSPALRTDVRDRLQHIAAAVIQNIRSLRQQNRSHLFAGIEVGDEAAIGVGTCGPDSAVSQATCGGYRSYMSQKCPRDHPLCRGGSLKPDDFNSTLVDTVRTYVEFLAKTLADAGISKDRIYSHTFTQWERGSLSYVPAAFNEFSRPGWTFYAPNLDVSAVAGDHIRASGHRPWGSVETMTSGDTAAWVHYLNSVFRNERLQNGRIVGLYNWEDIQDKAAALRAIRQVLTDRSCRVDVAGEASPGIEPPASRPPPAAP